MWRKQPWSETCECSVSMSVWDLMRASCLQLLALRPGLTPRILQTVLYCDHSKVSPLLYLSVRQSCQCVSPSLGDNETTEAIFLLPLAAKFHGDTLWLGQASMHSWPIQLTVSKRLKHISLFKSNKSLISSFRCIFCCVKKKMGVFYEWTNIQICLVLKVVGLLQRLTSNLACE